MISDPKGAPKDYWNPVGIDDPTTRAQLRNPCQLNPRTGDAPNRGALFARDSRTGHEIILHNGTLRGGRQGLTLAAFWDRYLLGPALNVHGLPEPFVKVADLDGPNPLGEIGLFAAEARRIKKLVRDEGETTESAVLTQDSITDYRTKGGRTRRTPQSELRIIEIVHDLVTDELARVMNAAGFVPQADRHGTHDLLLLKPRSVLFEVKTTLSSQDAYTGLGQLLLNGSQSRPKPASVYVCPAPSAGFPWFWEPLLRIGVEIVTYRSINGHPQINLQELQRVLPELPLP